MSTTMPNAIYHAKDEKAKVERFIAYAKSVKKMQETKKTNK